MIFAREISDPLTGLVKKVEKTAASMRERVDLFAIFCSDDEKLEAKLKALVEQENFTRSAVSICKPAGPAGFKVPKEADVTVVIFSKRVAQAAFTYRKGELTATEIERIVEAMDVGPATPFPVGYMAPAYVPERTITSGGYGADKAARGPNPNILIFARTPGDQLATLARKVDEIARDKSARLDSFLVMVGQGKELETQLKDLAEKEKLQNTTLSVEPSSRVQAFQVSKQHDVTLLICENGASRAVYTLKWRDLTDKTCDKILADINKALQAHKARNK
jgi:hypothetical protein